ncbi:hypothetical protein [Auraticoccus monumenti]|uniref:Uncharacterized protein n=1 Tax=Auraticoccus monumenti TaxID=675864 RepID=A0A1G7CTG1_9ACTN|nr:hypothetical protein [Auraticoccus monumenti]SDE42579.1 hypothetical protein SAMN04489747_3372 [Auraticoccus monumenti]
MMWVLIIGGGVLLLLGALALWAVYLWRRGEELWSEVTKLGRQAVQLALLAEKIQTVPDQTDLEALRRRTSAGRRQP